MFLTGEGKLQGSMILNGVIKGNLILFKYICIILLKGGNQCNSWMTISYKYMYLLPHYSRKFKNRCKCRLCVWHLSIFLTFYLVSCSTLTRTIILHSTRLLWINRSDQLSQVKYCKKRISRNCRFSQNICKI